jgi:hypothetical protein
MRAQVRNAHLAPKPRAQQRAAIEASHFLGSTRATALSSVADVGAIASREGWSTSDFFRTERKLVARKTETNWDTRPYRFPDGIPERKIRGVAGAESQRLIVSSNHPIVADALAEAAVVCHGTAFHARGGGVGRAQALIERGASLQQAVSIAAQQAKGHAAELSLSTQLTTRAGIAGIEALTAPNVIANDRHLDLVVTEGLARVNGAQVGIGSPRYLAEKARRSLAPQVVVNTEARQILATSAPHAYQRTVDQMSHKTLKSMVVSEKDAHSSAVASLERALCSNASLGCWVIGGIAVAAGVRSALVSAGTAAAYELVERLFTGKPIDDAVLQVALNAGARSFATTTTQTYLQVSGYFAAARAGFEARLLHTVASNVAWAGAVADFVVMTSREIVRWLKREIGFGDLLRVTGVNACSAAGAALAATAATRLVAGAPWWLQILLVGLAAFGGNKLGRVIGESVFKPNVPVLGPEGRVAVSDVAVSPVLA